MPASIMSDTIEILVHGSAPCGVRDDQKYRMQARNFLDNFAVKVKPQQAFGEPSSTAARQSCSGGKARPASSRNLYSKAQHMVTSLPQGTGAPGSLIQNGTALQQVRQVSGKDAALPSSRPETDPSPIVYVKRTPYYRRARTEPVLNVIETPTGRRRWSHSNSFDTPPSVVPDSQPSFGKRPPDRSLPSLFEVLRGSFEIWSSPPSPKRRRLNQTEYEGAEFFGDPEPHKGRRAQASEVPNEHFQDHNWSIPTSDIPKASSISYTCVPTLFWNSIPRHRPIRTIQPSRPPTSTAAFMTHCTKPLRVLAANAVLATSYQPLSVARPVRPLERGYWLLQMSKAGWTAQRMAKFWRFVTLFVREGRAGWGTWAECERSDKNGEGNERLRVWCWGEVVREVWLMLLVASEWMVKGAGTTWVNATGEVVVKMA